MQQEMTKRKQSVKSTILDLSVNEQFLFPRRSYSTLRTTICVTKIEYPERDFRHDIVEDGILVTCLK